jgi:hypothetical protein
MNGGRGLGYECHGLGLNILEAQICLCLLDSVCDCIAEHKFFKIEID